MKLMLIFLVLMIVAPANAEQGYKWVLCQPDSTVNVRERASKKSRVVGYAMSGDRIEADRESGQWVHCTFPCEAGEGWIRKDYLVDDEPEQEDSTFETTAKNVLVRASAGGRVIRKLPKGKRLAVSMVSAEWSVTELGFIKTEYLIDVGGT